MSKAKLVFACKANAGRSVMAERFARCMADPSKVEIVSAGSEPGSRVHPVVAQVMAEIGIEVADHRPRRLDLQLAGGATILVTMGCGEACPFIAGATVIDWNIPDPRDMQPEGARRVRDAIKSQVHQLLVANGWVAHAPPA